MRPVHLTREPGSVVGWENRQIRGGTAFVVELPAGPVSPTSAARFAHAIIAVGRMLRY